MKYIVALSAYAAAASAVQVVGTYYMPVEESPSATESLPSATASSETVPTGVAVLGSPQAYTDYMPYTSMTADGYQQLECGYGYSRNPASGHCEPAAWYTQNECYETVLINKKSHCGPVVVTMTEDVTVKVTEVVPQTIYMTATHTEVQKAVVTNDVTQIYTTTDVQTSVRIWVSTEVNQDTETILYTLTATDVKTKVDIVTQTEQEVATTTQIEKLVLTETEDVFTTIVVPTTYVSIWETTEVNNETETIVETKSKMVTDFVTQTDTVVDTATVTDVQTALETEFVETTLISMYTTTEVINETETTVREVETFIPTTVTREVIQTDQVTTTESVEVLPTELIDCLGSCKSHYTIAPQQQQYGYEAPYAPAPAHTTGYTY